MEEFTRYVVKLALGLGVSLAVFAAVLLIAIFM